MKYIIYTRVSTDEQARSGLGLEAQLKCCMEYAQANNPDAEILVFTDAGKSGLLPMARRPQLMAAIQNCKKGDVLLAYRRDRLGRKVEENAALEYMIKKQKGSVVTLDIDERNMDPALAQLYKTISDAIGNYESAVKGARTSIAMASKRLKGEPIGRIPYGYRSCRKKIGEEEKIFLEPDPMEQANIQMMMQKRESGMSYREIQAWINSINVKNREGRKWQYDSVYRILTRSYIPLAPEIEMKTADPTPTHTPEQLCEAYDRAS